MPSRGALPIRERRRGNFCSVPRAPDGREARAGEVETGLKEGTASRSLPGQSPRAFPQRSPPAAANLAHFYRVNISPSFQRPGPRETDSHLQPPLPSRSSLPRLSQVLLLLPLGNAGGPPATAARSARPGPPAARPPARAHAPAPPSLRRPLSQCGRWGPTCGPCPAQPTRVGFFTSLLLFYFFPPSFRPRASAGRAAALPGSSGRAGTAALRGERT